MLVHCHLSLAPKAYLWKSELDVQGCHLAWGERVMILRHILRASSRLQSMPSDEAVSLELFTNSASPRPSTTFRAVRALNVLVLYINTPCPTLPALFTQDLDSFDRDMLIHTLAHIHNSQRGAHHPCERLHLHARFPRGLNFYYDLDSSMIVGKS